MTLLFSTRANVHIDGVSEKAIVAKLALGAMLDTYSDQQGVRVAVRDGDSVTMKVGRLPDYRYTTLQEREERRWAFLVFYFAKLRREKKRWRTITGLVSAARVLRFVVVGVWLLVVVSGCFAIFFVGFEMYRLTKALYGLCSRGLEVFIGFVEACTRRSAGMYHSVETEGALEGEDYEALPEPLLG